MSEVKEARLPQVGDTVRVIGGEAPIGKVLAFVGANTARVLWDGWSVSLAVVMDLEVLDE